MAISTYSDLKTAVASWLNRSDLTAVIPDFISLAEVHISRTQRAREMQASATANIDTQFFAAPADFLEVLSFRIVDGQGNGYQLIQATPAQISEALANSIQPTIPRFFTLIGDQFQIWPIPDQQYVGTLVYSQRIPALSDANPTNWLLEQGPDVYLYGALMQAAPYLRDTEALTLWKALFDQALEAMRVSDKPIVGPLRTDVPVRGLYRQYNVLTDY
jgi:hypothetical protein